MTAHIHHWQRSTTAYTNSGGGSGLTVVLDLYAVPTGSTVLLRSYAIAVTTSPAGDGGGFHSEAMFKNNGGTVTQIGSAATVISVASAGVYTPSWDVSGTSARIKVTGPTLTNASIDNWLEIFLYTP